MISLLLDAALMTLGLAIVSLVGGLLLALLLSAAELSRHVWLRWPVATLTTLIRGLPEILVVLFIYFGSSQLLLLLADGINLACATWLPGQSGCHAPWDYVEMSPFWCGVLALAQSHLRRIAQCGAAGRVAVPGACLHHTRPYHHHQGGARAGAARGCCARLVQLTGFAPDFLVQNGGPGRPGLRSGGPQWLRATEL